MSKPVYEIKVKTGSYQKDGETKNMYITIGAIFEGKERGTYIGRLNRWFNPAGVPSSSDDGILIYFQKPNDNHRY